MDSPKRLICQSDELLERGKGQRFKLPEIDERATGFAVRFNGKVFAYVNRCAHVPVELDWSEGDFFDVTQYYLICATHGAHYEPSNGHCVLGPCKGRALTPIHVVEENGSVFIKLDFFITR